MSTENENWNESSANVEGQSNNREGYKPYNRDNNRGYSNGRSNYGRSNGGYNNDRSSYNRQRPRFNANQRSYNNNGGGAFRPSSFGSDEQQPQQREFRPRFNQGEGNGYQQRGGYNNNRGGQGGYNRNNNGEGGYQQRGGYNNNRGGYNNNRGGQGGYNNNRGGYQQRPRTADYNPNAKYSHKKQLEYHDALLDPDAPIRLNKFLANAGICSRREADEFITAGVVSVNGVVVTELGTKVTPNDEVKFHEDPVKLEHKVYVLLNKPKDYVTTTDDPEARKTVMQLVAGACKERIYPVGRLDRNTTGVLLLTNDGDLASKLTHPKFLKKKIYHVTLDRNVAHSDLERIAAGLTLEDGEIHADAVSYASETDKSQVGIEIHSGKNRIVRRIFEHLGYRVTKLDRVLFAGLTKKNLRRGDWRYLTEAEVNMLRMGAFE
ncbi:MAG: RNA-binding S4 domain-containing protein [Bacteroidaceae bacterium]|nr:RNA-binding S4 domain-containing protein [Bacteroidaceae bacterium]